MGWDFYCDPSNGKAKVLEDLRLVGNESWELLGMAVVGSHVWRALKNVSGRKIIALDWIKGGGRNSGWGVKDLPYHEHLDCPQKIIDLVLEHQVNDPERYAKWKIMVAEERAGKRAKGGSKKWIDGLKRGDVFYWNGERIEFLFFYATRKGARRIAGMPGKGGTYRYPASQIRQHAEVQA